MLHAPRLLGQDMVEVLKHATDFWTPLPSRDGLYLFPSTCSGLWWKRGSMTSKAGFIEVVIVFGLSWDTYQLLCKKSRAPESSCWESKWRSSHRQRCLRSPTVWVLPALAPDAWVKKPWRWSLAQPSLSDNNYTRGWQKWPADPSEFPDM